MIYILLYLVLFRKGLWRVFLQILNTIHIVHIIYYFFGQPNPAPKVENTRGKSSKSTMTVIEVLQFNEV